MQLSSYINRIKKDNEYHKRVVDYVCLESGFLSITDFGDGFEGFVIDEETQAWYLPHLTLTEDMEVCDFDCQCAESHGLCIHKAGLAWGVNFMQQMECGDLSEAIKLYCEKTD